MTTETTQEPMTPEQIRSLQEGARTLGRILASNYRVMEAARIEMRQNGAHAAMQWILNSLEPTVYDGPDGTEWDGKESAQAWFNRVQAADEAAARGVAQ